MSCLLILPSRLVDGVKILSLTVTNLVYIFYQGKKSGERNGNEEKIMTLVDRWKRTGTNIYILRYLQDKIKDG